MLNARNPIQVDKIILRAIKIAKLVLTVAGIPYVCRGDQWRPTATIEHSANLCVSVRKLAVDNSNQISCSGLRLRSPVEQYRKSIEPSMARNCVVAQRSYAETIEDK